MKNEIRFFEQRKHVFTESLNRREFDVKVLN